MTQTLSQFGRLALALAVTWLLLVGPAWLMAGTAAAEGISYAAGICLLPGFVLLVLGSWISADMHPLSGVLAGMGVRIAVVLVAAVALCVYRPDLRSGGFLISLAPFYLVALFVETRQLLQVIGSESELSGASAGR